MNLYFTRCVIVCGVLASVFCLHAQESVIISEFMASNSRTLADENGEFSDWIELANNGNAMVNLAGWYLTDDASNLTKWQFPATNLNAGAFLVVFASNKDRRVAGLPLHTNFKLSTGGEYLGLIKPDGTNIVSQFAPTFPPQAPDVSYGLGILSTNRTLIATNSPVLIRVPLAAEATDWTSVDYDDSSWLQGTNGVGYGTTNVTQADYSAIVLPLSPVGYWRFTEPTGPTAANSGSGSGLDATYTAATVGAAGPRPPSFKGFETNNTAPTFNGTTAYAAVNNSLLNDRGAFTIGGWIKPAVTPGSRIGLFGQNDCVEFGFIGGTLLECWTPSGGSLDITYPFPMNQWHHVVAVGDGVTIRIFADGVLLGTGGTPTASYGSSSFNFNIGGGGIYDNTGNFFNGQIDEVVAFHRALTTNEIFSLFDGGSNPVAVPVLPFVNTDINSAMSNVNATAYFRLPFTLADPTNITLLTLRMRYDDGFIVFINGVEIARVNAPLAPAYDSAALIPHSPAKVDEFRFGTGMLREGTNILAIQGLNTSADDADFLISAELIGRSIAAQSSAPVYFTGPTPGGPNGGGVAAPGPAILNPAYSPTVPRDAEDLLVTTHVFPTFYPVASVTMRYRIMFNPEIEVQMFDDGFHGDGVAGDGVFGATIPASASTNGQMIRWSFRATDTQGFVSRWPLFSDPASTPQYFGTIVDPTNVTSQLPIFHLFVLPAQQTGIDSESGGRASFFYDGEFYDNIYMELRGNTSAGYVKKSHRMEFNGEHKLRHPGPGGRIAKTSLLAEFVDPAFLRSHLSFWLLDLIGVPSPFEYPVRVQLNNQFYQLAFHNDVIGQEQMARLGFDPAGALYKAVGTFEPSFFSTGVFQKLEPKNDPTRTDYLQLANGINEASSITVRRNTVFDQLDVPEVINQLAGTRFCSENDDVWANMSMYRDTFGDQLWRTIPFDRNASWGQRYGGNSPLEATIDTCKSFPLYGGSSTPSCDGPAPPDSFNRLYDVIVALPETRQMLLRRMRTIMDQVVQPPGTPVGSLIIENHIKYMTNLMSAEAALDRTKWGLAPWAPGKSFADGVGDLLTQFVGPRRQHWYITHCITNTSRPIGITPANNAGIPIPQPPNAFVSVVGVEFNPSSGNQNEEYVCLTNPTPLAVEISGWKLDGAVQFTFAPGTVVPSNSVLYVSPDTRAFRARTTGPRGGQGLFVVGPSKGQLSARGETLRVVNTLGQTVNTFTYPGAPGSAQQFLRVTELMYHPSPLAGNTNDAEEFEFIELKNISTTETLDLTGVRLTNGVDFTFTGSAVTSLAPGAAVLVVRNTNAFAARYGGGFSIAGQYAGALNNGGERIQLLDASNEEILDFSYNNSWYPITDGLGFSLVAVNENAAPDEWNNKSNWRPSGELQGSPDIVDPPSTIPPVVINEALTRTDNPPPPDTIELYNPTGSPVNLVGWFLTDDFNFPKKFRISSGNIPAGGYITFDESQFNPTPGLFPSFSLSSAGDEVYLFSGDANTNLTGYVHGFSFGAAEDGVSFGRYITSIGEEHFVAQTTSSLGLTNAGPKVGPVVITEVMYRPPDIGSSDDSIDEFIELFNSSLTDVALFDPANPTNTWQVKGGIDFVFPTNSSIPSTGYLVLVNFDPTNVIAVAAFQSTYGISPSVPLFGPYGGKLNNSGDKIELKKPTTPVAGTAPYVLIDKVAFGDSYPWPAGADGYGLSLQRRDVSKYGNDPINWLAAPPTPGGATVTSGTPPSIDQQPVTQEVIVYHDSMLSVHAVGTEPLSYQWRFNGSNIPGATSSILQLTNFQAQQIGDYQVLVFNTAGSQLSSNASVTAVFPVLIISQSQSRGVRLPSLVSLVTTNITFSVSAFSNDPLTYQWKFNGADIPFATNSTYALSTVSIANHGTYQAIITDHLGPIASDPVSLLVTVLPVFTQALPSVTTALVGDNVPYTVSITGFPPPFTYEFRKGTIFLTNLTTSATTATFTLTNVQTSSSGTYRVAVSNLANGTLASFNTLTVLLDTDGDRVPDNWETQYHFNPNDSSDGGADPDHDGLTNLQEYLAGTNPTNAASVLKIDSLTVTNLHVMKFFAASNKTYTVLYTPALDNLNWINLTNVSARTTNRTAVVITDPAVTPGRFYRLVTPQQP